MSEKELDEFKEVTMPKNLNTPTRLDPFMKAVLEKRGHNFLTHGRGRRNEPRAGPETAQLRHSFIRPDDKQSGL